MPFSGSLQQLANGDFYRPLRIECFDYQTSGDHVLLASCICCLQDLKRCYELREDLNSESKRHSDEDHRFESHVNSPFIPMYLSSNSSSQQGPSKGLLVVEIIDIDAKPTFLDYVKGGCELNFMVAIDYTASNGDPRQLDSLHYVDPTGNSTNHYIHAITSVGRVLEGYDSDKLFPVYGFGGSSPYDPQGQVNHCFALNGNEQNPEVQGVQGILEAYFHSIQIIQLSGPTIFTQIIAQASSIAASECQDQGHQKYFILMIITDGVINDMDETIHAIVSASHLPLSILIVGVGDANFAPMRKLDSDDELLYSKTPNNPRNLKILIKQELGLFYG